MGRSDDPVLLAGESGYDEREVVPAARREGDEVTLSAAANMKQGLFFWSGDYAGAVGATSEAIEHIGGVAGLAVSQDIYLVGALSMLRYAPRIARPSTSCARRWRCTASARRAHRKTTRHRLR